MEFGEVTRLCQHRYHCCRDLSRTRSQLSTDCPSEDDFHRQKSIFQPCHLPGHQASPQVAADEYTDLQRLSMMVCQHYLFLAQVVILGTTRYSWARTSNDRLLHQSDFLAVPGVRSRYPLLSSGNVGLSQVKRSHSFAGFRHPTAFEPTFGYSDPSLPHTRSHATRFWTTGFRLLWNLSPESSFRSGQILPALSC